MCLGITHLNEHKFKHGFNHIINPICICGGDIQSINHFFLICPEYCEARQTFFDNIQSIDKMLLSQHQSSLTHLLLYDDPKRNSNVNAFILNTAIEFILSSGRFNRPLLKGASNMFSLSLIHFWYSFLFVFVYLFGFVISHFYLYPKCLQLSTYGFLGC